MKYKSHLLAACLLAVASLCGAATPRKVVTLDKEWGIKPITNTQRKAKLAPVTLPHTWNADYLPGGTKYNREMMVYKRTLTVTPEMEGKRLFLYFEGANSAADVFVNYRTVAHHLGGYTAFCTEITDYVKPGDNDLEVWVSNAFRSDVLPISGDFNVYGGLHRPCHLIVTGQNCIDPLFYASPGVLVHQDRVTDDEARFTVETRLSLKDVSRPLTVQTKVLDAEGRQVAGTESVVNVPCDNVRQPLAINGPTLWDGVNNPYLYTVQVDLCQDGKVLDRVTQKTGFRYFHADPERGFFLNGRPYDLHGFCRHEDIKGKGSALTAEDYQTDLPLIKEIGATAVRLAHYPHAKPMYEMGDENGLILWTEIPLCGPGGYGYTGFVGNEPLKAHARQVLKELVYQNINHPSICFWGIFNELLITDDFFQAYDNPVAFVKELNGLYKSIDPSRLTCFATCVDQTNYQGCSDLIAWNKYFGWHEGDKIGPFMDNVKAHAGGQPVGVSEYGFGGSTKQHLCPTHDRDKKLGSMHPEGFQAISHELNWEALSARPYLWSKIIWVFSDFQSFIRNEGDTPGINDKGLVTYDRQTRKDAFYFYKVNWNKEPMLHLCDQRYTDRTYADTQVKVYTTAADATLYVNGKKVGKKKADGLHRIVWENVTLQPGENTIEVSAKAGKQTLTEKCVWTLK